MKARHGESRVRRALPPNHCVTVGIFDKIFKQSTKKESVRRPRIGVRVPMEERAEMRRHKDGSAQSVILADLSPGGARIASPLKLGLNEGLTLIINTGRRDPFEIGCNVVSVRPRAGRLHYDYGVKFIAVRPGEIERLRRFVTERDDSRKTGVAAFSQGNRPK